MNAPKLIWTNPEDPLHLLVRVACMGTTDELRVMLERRRRCYPRIVPEDGCLATWRWQLQPEPSKSPR